MNNLQSATIIKQECSKRSISISKLLNDLNIRKSLIYDMEKRDSTPSIEVIYKIADYLECSTDYLLGRKEYDEYNNKTYSDTENKLIEFFRDLNEDGQEYIIKQFKFALSQSEYKKHNQNEIQKHA